MNIALYLVLMVVVMVVGVWVAVTNASSAGQAVLYSLGAIALAAALTAFRVNVERVRRRRVESGRGQSRHAWLFFLVLGPPMAGYGVWLVIQPHSDDAGNRWPFGTTSLGVFLLVAGVGALVYAFVMRAQRDRQRG